VAALTNIRLLRLLSEPHSDAELLFCGSRALLLCLLSHSSYTYVFCV
jgi:hypothetical protein